jgi:alginate O-acetyltransferase complex protein AlgJ
MKRLIFRRSAIFPATFLALVFSGCSSVAKKDGGGEEAAAADAVTVTKSGDKPAAAQPEAATAGGTPTVAPSKKYKSPLQIEAEKTKTKEKPAAKPEAKPEAKPKEKSDEKPAASPAAAAEFAGLAKGEAEFVMACREVAVGDQDTMTGKDGMVFATADVRALGTNSKTGTPRHQAMVAAIAAHAESLRAAGVELIVAPVPLKPVIYPDFLGGGSVVKDRRYDTYLQQLRTELGRYRVRVADVTKELRSDRFDRAAASFPRAGLVWSPAAVLSASRVIHGVARSTTAAKAVPRDKTIVARTAGLTQNGETFRARSVGWAQGQQLVPAAAPKEGASILIIGDENAGVHRIDGVNASLADQLSFAFGAPVDSRVVPGLGWNEAIQQFSPAKAPSTKIVVWCFSAASFLDGFVDGGKKPAARAGRSGGEPVDDVPPAEGTLPPASPAGAGLLLRDDPGLDVRAE